MENVLEVLRFEEVHSVNRILLSNESNLLLQGSWTLEVENKKRCDTSAFSRYDFKLPVQVVVIIDHCGTRSTQRFSAIECNRRQILQSRQSLQLSSVLETATNWRGIFRGRRTGLRA